MLLHGWFLVSMEQRVEVLKQKMNLEKGHYFFYDRGYYARRCDCWTFFSLFFRFKLYIDFQIYL